jgi:hypothetical protein
MAPGSKQLLCPQCGEDLGTAVWGLFRGLRITSNEGFQLSWVRDDLLLQLAQQQLAAAPAGERDQAERRVKALLRDAGDRFYDLKCPQGHYTLMTAPRISQAIRRANGPQVTLTP